MFLLSIHERQQIVSISVLRMRTEGQFTPLLSVQEREQD